MTDEPMSYTETFNLFRDHLRAAECREKTLLVELLWALPRVSGELMSPEQRCRVERLIRLHQDELVRLDQIQLLDSAIDLGATDEELAALWAKFAADVADASAPH